MNSLDDVVDKMKVETLGKKVRLTIEVDYYPATGFLSINGAPINCWQPPPRGIAAWQSASRFASQMIERFEQDATSAPQQSDVA